MAAVGAGHAQPSDAPAPDPAVTWGATWNVGASSNARGGARAGATSTSHLHANATADLNRLLGWQDTTAYADVLWVQGGQPGALVGDAQGVSNIAAPNTLRLYEAWLERNLAGDRLSALFGLYDLSSEFYRLQAAGLFFNSSFGTGAEFAQSGLAGPSIFPNTAVGARLATKPTAQVVLRLALLNGAPVRRPALAQPPPRGGDGALWAMEAAWIDRPLAQDGEPQPGLRIGRGAGLGDDASKIALGAWHYTATFADLSETSSTGQPVMRRGSTGAYVIAEGMLSSPGRGPRVKGFLQLGAADPRVDRFGTYLGLGLTASGLIAERASDQLGFGAAMARNGSHYLKAQRAQGRLVTASEIALELTYRIALTDALSLQPDIQYVIRPNTAPTLANALITQLRLQASF